MTEKPSGYYVNHVISPASPSAGCSRFVITPADLSKLMLKLAPDLQPGEKIVVEPTYFK